MPIITTGAFSLRLKTTTIGMEPPSRINTVFFRNTFERASAAEIVALASSGETIGYAPCRSFTSILTVFGAIFLI